MCLYTTYIKNPKYKSNKKNGGQVPPLLDKRLEYVPTKCGRCIECRMQKKREWVVRLSEEIRQNKHGIFVTLTIDNESFYNLRESKEESENDLCTKALRRFLERVRKETKKSIRHWVVTELGEEKGRIHMHGIFFCNPRLIEKHWKYGYVFIGDFVNEKTIFYITKYMLKQNENNRSFIPKVLCSSGIGRGYLERRDSRRHRYVPRETIESYRLRNGQEVKLPQYYRLKVFDEETREKLWIEKQESEHRYLMGEKVPMNDEETYKNVLQFYQDQGKKLYGDNPDKWDLEKQINRIRKMRKARERCRNVPPSKVPRGKRKKRAQKK